MERAKIAKELLIERDEAREQVRVLARELEIILRWGSSMWASRPLAEKFPGENIAIVEARKVLASISENTKISDAERSE